MNGRPIYNYYLIESLHKEKRDLIDLLIPLTILFMGTTNLEYSIKSIQQGLKERFNLRIPIRTIETVTTRLKNEQFINFEKARYSASDESAKKDTSKLNKINKYGLDIFLCIKEARLAMDIITIKNNFDKKNGTNIEFNELEFVLDRLAECDFLKTTGVRYKLTDEGNKYYLEIVKETKRVREGIEPLLEDIKNYLNKELKSNYDIKVVEQILLSFIHKNIEPLADFIETKVIEDIKKYKIDLGADQERILCEYVKERVNDHDSNFYNAMKDLILGSTISALYNSKDIEMDKDKLMDKERLKDIEIILDTNVLFYLLGYNFPEFCDPTLELYDLLRENGFKFCIFDITLKEADSVLRTCMGLFKRLYIPGVKVNSICYYLRMKYRTTSRIQILKNRLAEDIKNKGIIIKETGIILNKYRIPDSTRESIKKYKDGQPRLPQSHDIAAIDLIKDIRKEEVDSIAKSKAIFLTADQRLFDYNYLEMGHKENQTIPEVFVDRLLTNILWLMDPRSDVSLESLIATCSRDVFIKRNVWEIVCKRLEYLHDVKNVNYDDIFSIVYLDSIKSLIKDLKIEQIRKTNVESNKLTDNEAELLKELDDRLEKGLKAGLENKEKLKQVIREKSDDLHKTKEILNINRDILTNLLDQIKKISNQEFDKLLYYKAIQKENEKTKQDKLKKYSRTILLISIILLLFLPVALSYVIGIKENNYDLFNIAIGAIAVLSLFGFIYDRVSDNNILREYWDWLELKIYTIIRRNNMGLIISYIQIKDTAPEAKGIEEHIEISNVSAYAQDISNCSFSIGSNPHTFVLKDNIIIKPGESKNAYICIGKDTDDDIFIQQGESDIWKSDGIRVILRAKNGRTIDRIEAPIFRITNGKLE
jgi:hypothetical protein